MFHNSYLGNRNTFACSKERRFCRKIVFLFHQNLFNLIKGQKKKKKEGGGEDTIVLVFKLDFVSGAD